MCHITQCWELQSPKQVAKPPTVIPKITHTGFSKFQIFWANLVQTPNWTESSVQVQQIHGTEPWSTGLVCGSGHHGFAKPIWMWFKHMLVSWVWVQQVTSGHNWTPVTCGRLFGYNFCSQTLPAHCRGHFHPTLALHSKLWRSCSPFSTFSVFSLFNKSISTKKGMRYLLLYWFGLPLWQDAPHWIPPQHCQL